MAEKKYHINPETGRPNQCTATVRDCKFAVGDMVPEHYDSKEDAQKAYETKMEKEKGSTSTVKKPLKKTGSKKSKPGASVYKFTPLQQEGIHKNGVYVDYEELERKILEEDMDEEWDKVLDTYPEGRAYKKIKNNPGYDVDEKTYSSIYGNYMRAITGYDETISISGYSPAVNFNEGEYYHPTPDEDWHKSDISYTSPPSFTVASKHAFVQDVILDNVNSSAKYQVTTLNNDVLEELEKAGLFDESSYEAKIEHDWYGDEFRGFVMNKEVKEKAVEILAEEAIIQS